MKRILIGSCGGLTGVYLAKQFARFDDFEIFGSDVNANTIGKFFVKKLIKVQKIDDENFISILIKKLNQNKIDIYIPTYSKEIKKVSEYEEEIRKQTSTRFIVSPFSTYEALDDKLIANLNLKSIGIPVPKIYNTKLENHTFPLIKKQKIGSGGSGCIKVSNKIQLEGFKFDENSLFMEYIFGNEFTCDCMFDENGNLLGYNQRKRDKCIGGAVSSNYEQIDILPYIEIISKKWKIKGCVNFQYIVKNDVPYFIDCNLRYASGGLPLSVKSGLDVPLAIRKILLHEPYSADEFRSDKRRRIMYRYFEELYEEI